MFSEIARTVLLIVLWAAVHSLTASAWFKSWWMERLGRAFAFYRIGSHFEEQRLRLQYGDVYRAYARRVSCIFPAKWLRNLFVKTTK